MDTENLINTKLKSVCGVGINEKIRPIKNLGGAVYFYFGKERYCATEFGLVFRRSENYKELPMLIKDKKVKSWFLSQLKATESGCDHRGRMMYEYGLNVRKCEGF